MKKLFFVIFIFSLIFLSACGGEQGDTEENTDNTATDYPNDTITLIVSFGPGGGTDIGARDLVPYVEEELGVDIQIQNIEGGGGWVGWNDLVNADPDGYTLGYLNTPNIISGYMNPELERNHDLNSFTTIANHVSDPAVIAVNEEDERFETIDDFIEYAKNNDVYVSSQGVGSSEHVLALQMNEEMGTNFDMVQYSSVPEIRSDLLGGHIDAMIISLNAVYNAEEGSVNNLAVFSEERSEFLPEVPTMEEAGFGEMYSSNYRGIGAPAGVDSEIISILEDAFEKAILNEEHIEFMGQSGLEIDFTDGSEFRETLEAEEARIESVKDLLGW